MLIYWLSTGLTTQSCHFLSISALHFSILFMVWINYCLFLVARLKFYKLIKFTAIRNFIFLLCSVFRCKYFWTRMLIWIFDRSDIMKMVFFWLFKHCIFFFIFGMKKLLLFPHRSLKIPQTNNNYWYANLLVWCYFM